MLKQLTHQFPSIKLLMFIAMCGLFSCQSPPAEELQKVPAEFDWLTGKWQRTTEKSITIESWHRLNEQNYQGNSVRLRKTTGDTAFVESLMLTKMSGKWYYLAKVPENRLPIAFEMTESGESRFTFENPQHDFPQRIAYQPIGKDSLTVVVNNPNDSTSRPINFRFSRQ